MRWRSALSLPLTSLLNRWARVIMGAGSKPFKVLRPRVRTVRACGCLMTELRMPFIITGPQATPGAMAGVRRGTAVPSNGSCSSPTFTWL